MHSQPFTRRNRHCATPGQSPDGLHGLRRGRFLWPSLLLLAAPLAAQDSARYQITWTVPKADETAPPATFYHWQLVLGDTTPKQPLTSLNSIGVTYGYVNVYQNNRYGYPTLPMATVTIARPAVDSLGPFRLAVQPGYRRPDSTTVMLGAYTWTEPWWVPRSGVPLNVGPPLVVTGYASTGPPPAPILSYAIAGIPWP